MQLCAILESRQSLRKCGVYFVIREMDKSEPDAEISQVTEQPRRSFFAGKIPTGRAERTHTRLFLTSIKLVLFAWSFV